MVELIFTICVVVGFMTIISIIFFILMGVIEIIKDKIKNSRTIKCPYCATECKKNDNFCRWCGYEFK